MSERIAFKLAKDDLAKLLAANQTREDVMPIWKCLGARYGFDSATVRPQTRSWFTAVPAPYPAQSPSSHGIQWRDWDFQQGNCAWQDADETWSMVFRNTVDGKVHTITGCATWEEARDTVQEGGRNVLVCPVVAPQRIDVAHLEFLLECYGWDKSARNFSRYCRLALQKMGLQID